MRNLFGGEEKKSRRRRKKPPFLLWEMRKLNKKLVQCVQNRPGNDKRRSVRRSVIRHVLKNSRILKIYNIFLILYYCEQYVTIVMKM